MAVLLSGNEAVARGAYEAGARFAAAYPGTPSTEILEEIASSYPDIYSEWSVNEKVALEVAIGASLGGIRALVAMKHVGLNVAADPLMTSSYTGVNGGLVIVSADDPGMHSSQNEQDNRFYAKFANVPMLEPADSQEAKDFTRMAFDISEEFDTPVIIRMTTRICHGRSRVELGERMEPGPVGYAKDERKYVMIPAYARARHTEVEKRRLRLERFSESTELNRVEFNDVSIGIISSGVAYQYAREVYPEASFLKLGVTNPLPRGKIMEFAGRVKRLIVVEELEPFLEDQIRALGVDVIGKEKVPRVGELSPELLRSALEGHGSPSPVSDIPPRPPVMCPGCPHRGVFHVLRKLKMIVTGDIGCYTLSVLPPLRTMDTCICMGASIGAALGLERALGDESSRRTVAVLGDSTFVHSGITGLVNAVYNRSNSTVIILDNRTTAMTGHQDNPGTGRTLRGERTKRLDFIRLSKAIGVKNVYKVDPYDLAETEDAIREATSRPGASVVVAERECALLSRAGSGTSEVDSELCVGCGLCLKLGCPAIGSDGDKAKIDPILCYGCGVCSQVCPKGAISTKRR